MSKPPSVARNDASRIVINDASCLIDLHKGGILRAMLLLPYQFQVALPVRANELLTIPTEDWRFLATGGLTTVDLPGEAVAEVEMLMTNHAALSPEDCFSLVLARRTQGSLLLTGDGALRRIAQGYHVPVHGVLWVVDELIRLDLADAVMLRACLEIWRDDPLVWLPNNEVAARIRRLT
jgi:predicted nucleic acid-binding protein